MLLLEHIQNALARTVVQAPKFKHITPILKSLQWLKVSERIEYKIISLTYKILNTTQRAGFKPDRALFGKMWGPRPHINFLTLMYKNIR